VYSRRLRPYNWVSALVGWLGILSRVSTGQAPIPANGRSYEGMISSSGDVLGSIAAMGRSYKKVWKLCLLLD